MPTSTPEKRLLLFGASRGLGLAIAEEYLKLGWHVVATARHGSGTALHDLVDKADGRLDIEIVDITDPAQVAALRERLGSDRFDLLFVNAGVTNDDRETIADVSTEEFVRVMVTNALSPMRVVETFKDLVPPTGAIAIMSSGQGSVGNNETGGHEVYRASKAALNTLMRSFAARHRDDPRTLLLLAPGWVRTDMGGPQARLAFRTASRTWSKSLKRREEKAASSIWTISAGWFRGESPPLTYLPSRFGLEATQRLARTARRGSLVNPLSHAPAAAPMRKIQRYVRRMNMFTMHTEAGKSLSRSSPVPQRSPIGADAVIVVKLSLILAIAPRRFISDRIGGAALQPALVEMDNITSQIRVVFQHGPGKRMVVVSNPEEAAERQDRVRDLSRQLVDHQIVNRAEVVAGRVEDFRPLHLIGCDEVACFLDGFHDGLPVMSV